MEEQLAHKLERSNEDKLGLEEENAGTAHMHRSVVEELRCGSR